jgi:GH15 family glucan-1,4-alpha-glucosidase
MRREKGAMPVYLSTSVVGNDETLLTLGHAGEIMAWFYPHKDHAQHIYQCLPAVYNGAPFHGHLHWTWGDEWQREQQYLPDTNIVQTTLTSHLLGAQIILTDVVPVDDAVLLRRIEVKNIGTSRLVAGIFHYGDWNMGGIRMGNALRFDAARRMLVQSHRDASAAIGGDALETWQCGKAGEGWGSNAQRDLEDGHLNQQDLEIGDVNWSCGFRVDLHEGESTEKLLVFALAPHSEEALQLAERAIGSTFETHLQAATEKDHAWLQPGLQALQVGGGAEQLPEVLLTAYKRSLLCLPLLNGVEGAAVAAPEFDPEFVSCGGYGYFWPRDGGEYVSGLIDAGYSSFAAPMFDWCARHQDPSGLWHQRYFLNGEPGPNWCLPPDTLQIDQVGAVLWAYGKWQSQVRGAKPVVQDEAAVAELKARASISAKRAQKIETAALEKLRGSSSASHTPNLESYQDMIRKAADYLVSRMTDKGVHGNAFDTWETFIGSFTYSNAAIYAAFLVAGKELDEPKYLDAAKRMKEGVLKYFVRDEHGYPYLVRGFDFHGESDSTVDSASLGAIEPFGLLDLNDDNDLRLAEGTLRAIRERLEVDWEGGRAIRRFEGDAYVGGVPACVNTLWMARCNLHVGARLRELGRAEEANRLRDDAQLYLTTVLRRATPTGLLPELMQGPTGQSYWAAPHGWAMSSFVSGVLKLAQQLD